MKRNSFIAAVIMISAYQVQAQEDLQNQNLNNVNTLTINDPGINEGIQWLQTNSNWQLDVTPLNRSNADGNLNLFGQSNNVVVWRPLHIYSSTSGDAILKLEADSDNNNESDNSRIEMFQDGGDLGAYIGFNKDWGGSWEPDNVFRIGTRYAGVDSYNRLVIKTSNGNVGVGTDDPSNRLHVSKSVNGPEFIAKIENTATTGEINGLIIQKTNSNSDGANNDKLLDIQTSSSTVFRVLGSGNVGIGVDDPDSKLVVDGKIRSEEVKVEIINGPDYVFEPDYKLRTLKETKEYIAENKHLPEIPSAQEMEVDGVELGDMNMRLLKKIEELTLYQIQLMEEMEAMKKELQELKK